MYIAYSAMFPAPVGPAQTKTNQTEIFDDELSLRYQAYHSVCSKYHREIVAIQKYLPGWQPKFQ
jgi:hypothetical protein